MAEWVAPTVDHTGSTIVRPMTIGELGEPHRLGCRYLPFGFRRFDVEAWLYGLKGPVSTLAFAVQIDGETQRALTSSIIASTDCDAFNGQLRQIRGSTIIADYTTPKGISCKYC